MQRVALKGALRYMQLQSTASTAAAAHCWSLVQTAINMTPGSFQR
jgi:hypothetical protein